VSDPLQDWVAELSRALEIDASAIDTDALLDLARAAAHGIARPAAPVTTFLVGLAAGRRGGSAEAIAEYLTTAQVLAESHESPED
jgi:Domain of unknown function (DUF6457)